MLLHADAAPCHLITRSSHARRRHHWDQQIDIHEITSMPQERPPLIRWRRVALLAAGGVLVSTALLRYSARR